MALSTDGISHQIVSSLLTYRKDKLGTINDCKVVINHLIRKFSEPLAKEGLQQFYRSKNITENSRVIKEHLLPVHEIMNHLLSLNLDISKTDLAKEISQYLTKSLVIVSITEAEDETLNAHGYQRKMPLEYFDANHSLHSDAWARYKSAGIYSNIVRSEFTGFP